METTNLGAQICSSHLEAPGFPLINTYFARRVPLFFLEGESSHHLTSSFPPNLLLRCFGGFCSPTTSSLSLNFFLPPSPFIPPCSQPFWTLSIPYDQGPVPRAVVAKARQEQSALLTPCVQDGIPTTTSSKLTLTYWENANLFIF